MLAALILNTTSAQCELTFFSTDEGNYFGNNIGFPVEDALQFQSQLLLAQANDGLVTLSDGTTGGNFEVWYFDFSPNEFSPNSALLYLEPVGVEGFVEGTLIQDAFGYIPSGGIEITIEYTPYDCITQENIHEAVALWMTNYWDADSIYGPISEWDVTQVSNMTRLFSRDLHLEADGYDAAIPEAVSFNADISAWDVSNVTNMDRMFEGAQAFSQNINGWDVSSLERMYGIFSESTFNGPLNDWDVSSVWLMSFAFHKSDFNQPLSNWNVSNVTRMDYIFRETPFNQDISNWDVSNVTNLVGAFIGSDFNQPIGSWNTSNVTSFRKCFYGNDVFDEDLSSWNTASAVSFYQFFLRSGNG